MNLEIDFREKDIIELFKDVENINYKVCNLIIGDFIIKDKTGNILFAIERKSIKDLCASITDGRHSDQKSRLIESIHDSNKIVYIIEGQKHDSFFHGKTHEISKKSINSSILNLIFKHKYSVIFTESKQDTVDNIILLYTKIKESKLELTESIHSMKIIKRSDKINNNIFINMLSVIPGVSIKIATKIHDQFNTLNELMLSYTKTLNESDKKKMLSEIYITESRKVGKSVSEKIYYSMHGHNPENNHIKLSSKKEKNTSCLI